MNFAIGIDWGGTNISIGLVDQTGKIHKIITHTTASWGNKQKFLHNLSRQINFLIKTTKNIIGIGIGAPGIIDSDKGFIFELTNIPGWKNVPFVEIIKKEINLPVFIDNDVNVITLAEYFHGAGKNYANLLCLTLGTGVGGGLIINNQLYHGASLTAGEIGHHTVDQNGPLCGCGNYGCLEAFIGNKRIIEKAKNLLKKNNKSLILKLISGDKTKITPEIIALAAKKGDKVAIEIWEYVGQYLGIVLANTINLLNPDRIIIGGGVSKAGKILFDNIKKHTKKRALSVPCKHVSIVASKFKDKPGVIGAATLVFQKLNISNK